jgi:membrane-bound serine protease (ClpP class)
MRASFYKLLLHWVFIIMVTPPMALLAQDTPNTATDTGYLMPIVKDTANIAHNYTGKQKVYYFKLHDEIMPPAARLVDKAIDEAEAWGATLVIMELNTFGGRVDIADEIRSKLLNAKMPVAVWINDNAASAGALISIACDSIYMAPGSSIGAATVVSGEDGTQMPDKYQSYMRSTMRSTAEANGRDPLIAEAMVDDRIVIPGIIDSGFTLTFTTTEALKYGYSEGIADSREEVLKQIGVADYEMKEYEPGMLDAIIAFLMHPAVNSLLLMAIIGGIYFELQTPGVGFPLAAAVTAAVLFFAPLYLEGLAANWEILLFIVGVILLALEIFVIPGFGIAGISGIILIVGSLILSLVANIDGFDFTFASGEQLTRAVLQVTVILTVAIIGFLVFNERITTSAAFKKLTLQDSLSGEGYTAGLAELDNLAGQHGIAATDLRPSGKISIGEERYEASTDGELIEKGTEIVVVRSRGNYLQVRKA